VNAPLVPGVSRPPRKEDYFAIVQGLRPLCEGEELQLRASLLLMRDRAMATKKSACEPSWGLLEVVERLANENAMNHRVKLDDLREIRRVCLNIVCAASSLDTLFQPRLPLMSATSWKRTMRRSASSRCHV
jgi:hypothetical protein